MLWKLSEFTNFQLDEDEPDVRGWPVFDRDERVIGKVESLIVDTDSERISHFGVLVGERVLMVPLEQILLNREAHEILLPLSRHDKLERYPEFKGHLSLLERERRYYVTFAPVEPAEFEPVEIRDLLAPEWNRLENEGRAVSIVGSFGQTGEDCWISDGARLCGYRIWDREGNGILAANAYAVLDPETGARDVTEDFSPDFVRNVVRRYGTYVRIEGRYLPQYFDGGQPGILVDFIEGSEVARAKKR